MGYIIAAYAALAYVAGEASEALTGWEMYGVAFAPFVCMVYVPVLLQASLVCELQP